MSPGTSADNSFRASLKILSRPLDMYAVWRPLDRITAADRGGCHSECDSLSPFSPFFILIALVSHQAWEMPRSGILHLLLPIPNTQGQSFSSVCKLDSVEDMPAM